MSARDIPGRVFLDTSVVNFILDHGEEIHDGVELPTDANARVRTDVDALYSIFLAGQRAAWQLAVSPRTYEEITRTRNPSRLARLDSWFFDLWQYWQGAATGGSNSFFPGDVEETRAQMLDLPPLRVLPDVEDRLLLCDAMMYRCDLFCTRDWTTILKHRPAFRDLPLEVVTPAEWWGRVRPFAGLWV